MQIRCPVCDYSRNIDVSSIPPTAEFATCPKCRHRFRFRALDLDAVEKPAPVEPNPEHADVWDAVDSLHDKWREKDEHERAEGRPAEGPARFRETAVPWENPKHMGFWRSFARTTLWALTRPASFFGSLSRRPALLPALAYYLILGMLQHVFKILWTPFIGGLMREQLTELLGDELYKDAIGNIVENSLLSPAVLAVPFLLAIQLSISAMAIYVTILLLEPSRADFAVSFKIVSYAAAAVLVTVIPVAGTLIAPVWYMALLLIGCRSAFRLTWGKAFLVMSPLCALMFLAASILYFHLPSP